MIWLSVNRKTSLKVFSIILVGVILIGVLGIQNYDAKIQDELALAETQAELVKGLEPAKEKTEEALTWEDNPNNCDTKTQYIRADNFQCIDKKQATKSQTTYPVGCERYRPLVEKYDWDVRIAMAIMQAESSCNPNAANWNDNHGVCKGSFGLFQISCHGGAIYDPAANVQVAWQKYQARGWQPWGAFTNGSYLKFLN